MHTVHPLACKSNYLKKNRDQQSTALMAKKSQHTDEYCVGGLVCGWVLRATKAEKRYPWEVAASTEFNHTRNGHTTHQLAHLEINRKWEVLLCQKKVAVISSDLLAYFTPNCRIPSLDTKITNSPLIKCCSVSLSQFHNLAGVISVKLLVKNIGTIHF